MTPRTWPQRPSGRVVGRTQPDVDGISCPLVTVPDCTCGWGFPHEPHCGIEIDDSRPRRVFWPETEDKS